MVNKELGFPSPICLGEFTQVFLQGPQADRGPLQRLLRHSEDFSTLCDADLKARIMAEIYCWEKLQEYGRDQEACDLAERGMKLAGTRWGINDEFS